MHFAISSLKPFDTQNVPFSKADGKKDCSFHYMQDTYKINSGWGERTDFFRLKKAVLLFKMISLAEQVTRIHVCPGEMRLKSFLSLLCFFSSYENLLFTPPLGVKCIRTCWFLTALSVFTFDGDTGAKKGEVRKQRHE